MLDAHLTTPVMDDFEIDEWGSFTAYVPEKLGWRCQRRARGRPDASEAGKAQQADTNDRLSAVGGIVLAGIIAYVWQEL